MEYMILDVGGDAYAEKGESNLTGFEGKIEILSYSWNISNPIQSSPSNTGRTTGRPNFGELVITKKLDLTSPLFAFSCASAENIGTVKLILVRQDLSASGDAGTNFTYMTYTLANSLVSSVSVGGSGDIPVETVTLNYSAINWEYHAQLTELNQEDTLPKGWDLATNTAADAAGGGE
jgi:type VI secretion system secreted protein Hcp